MNTLLKHQQFINSSQQNKAQYGKLWTVHQQFRTEQSTVRQALNSSPAVQNRTQHSAASFEQFTSSSEQNQAQCGKLWTVHQQFTTEQSTVRQALNSSPAVQNRTKHSHHIGTISNTHCERMWLLEFQNHDVYNIVRRTQFWDPLKMKNWDEFTRGHFFNKLIEFKTCITITLTI